MRIITSLAITKLKGTSAPEKKTNPEKDSRREKFLLSYVVYSQIWLNLLVDDCQSSYITKLKGNQTKKRNPERSEKFVLSYVVYSQIWLNLLMDDCQFS
jgi:hypothetical protein